MNLSDDERREYARKYIGPMPLWLRALPYVAVVVALASAALIGLGLRWLIDTLWG